MVCIERTAIKMEDQKALLIGRSLLSYEVAHT